jgi:multidrug transporter EmrE-like cation transporter
VSKASVFANIVLAGLLLILGAVLFKESMDAKKIIGVVLCALGITLLK